MGRALPFAVRKPSTCHLPLSEPNGSADVWPQQPRCPPPWEPGLGLSFCHLHARLGPRAVRTRVWGRPWPYGATLWPGDRIQAEGRMARGSTHVYYWDCSSALPLARKLLGDGHHDALQDEADPGGFGISLHWWFSGRILACHAGGPGSIPGQCIGFFFFFFFLSPKDVCISCLRFLPNIILEKEIATHSSILAWKISWTDEPGGLESGIAESYTT